jgi:hypothetical protein
MALGKLIKSMPQLFRALRSLEESFQQRPQIETRSPDHKRDLPPGFDLLQQLTPGCHEITGCEYLVRQKEIQEMMRDSSLFSHGSFGGANIEIAINLDGVAIDDFSVELTRQVNGQAGFSGSRGAENDNERPIIQMEKKILIIR